MFRSYLVLILLAGSICMAAPVEFGAADDELCDERTDEAIGEDRSRD